MRVIFSAQSYLFERAQNSQLLGNQNTLVMLNVFDVFESHLFRNQTTLVLLYVFDSLKKTG